MADAHISFLRRFTARGWLHAVREDAAEQEAVDFGLRKRWLRREMNEAHFTPKGRAFLVRDGESRPIPEPAFLARSRISPLPSPKTPQQTQGLQSGSWNG